MNANFLKITEKALDEADEPTVLFELSAYISFLQSKERAGIERAVGAAGFSGGWSPESLSKFANLINIQKHILMCLRSILTARYVLDLPPKFTPEVSRVFHHL